MLRSSIEWDMAILIAFLSAIAFAHLMNYLVAIKAQMYPFKSAWIGPMRSSPRV